MNAPMTQDHPTETLDYAGSELGLFANATHWKAYGAAVLRDRIGGDVLDVGAGLGSNIRHLMNDRVRAWTALEPDPGLARLIPQADRVTVALGTLATLPPDRQFDTILYMDVLEHIADDRAEVARAANALTPGGCLIVLAPAHQFLFSPFDAAIGHFRRYTRGSLRALTPAGCHVELCRMLDSVGFFASLANRMLLRQSDPTPRQIAVWDRLMVPLSRLLDPVLGFCFGKSVLMVWRKTTPRPDPR